MLALILFSLNPALAEEPVPGSSPTPIPEVSPRPSRGTTVRIRRGPRVLARPDHSREMPPAGSAATGGTSSSPGGAPTTPYR